MIYSMINPSAFDFILIIGKKKPILSVPDVCCQAAGTVPESTSLFRQRLTTKGISHSLLLFFFLSELYCILLEFIFVTDYIGQNRGLLMKCQGITERNLAALPILQRKFFILLRTPTFQKCLLSSGFKKMIFLFLNYNRKINNESQPTLESNKY
jgi:hypothetical protein